MFRHHLESNALHNQRCRFHAVSEVPWSNDCHQKRSLTVQCRFLYMGLQRCSTTNVLFHAKLQALNLNDKVDWKYIYQHLHSITCTYVYHSILLPFKVKLSYHPSLLLLVVFLLNLSLQALLCGHPIAPD